MVEKVALVVDDSAAMRRMQQRLLEGLGWTVSAAADGEEAIARLHDVPTCQLMLTDWHMPNMDGVELIRRVRSSGNHPHLKILMVTSDSVLSAVQLAIDAGADDFLMKPFTSDSLRERIEGVMDA
jgi:two-component system chemotaxis response regulator CheY